MDVFGRRLLSIGIIAALVTKCVICEIENKELAPDNEQPTAEKLTIEFQSTSNRIPPQIAYFIPDRFLNQTNLGIFNTNPPIVNILPTNNTNNQTNRDRNRNNRRRNRDRDRRNRRRNRNRDRSDSGDYNDDDYSDSGSSQDSRDTDLFMSPQQTVRFVSAVPPSNIQSFVDEDSTTSYQNLDHQIDFTRIPDKKPDFSRFKELERATRKNLKLMKKHYKRWPDTSDASEIIYAHTAPNVRSKIASLKKYHRNEYGTVASGLDDGGSNSRYGSDHGYNEQRWSQKIPSNKNMKMRKNRTKYQNAYYAMKQKLSQPISSAEMESVSDSHDLTTSNERYEYAASAEHNYNTDNIHGVQTLQQFTDREAGKISNKQKRRRPKKGFTILLTKVMKQPSPYRVQRMDTANEQQQQQQKQRQQQQNLEQHDENDGVHSFVPTRVLSSVRETVKVKHLPLSHQKAAAKSKLIETGSHLIYTEDGYQDKQYDHGDEDISLEYDSRRSRMRTRRDANVKELRGQELIDHLDNLIRNVSDYLNSSEIIPKVKYPLYNETHEIEEVSPVRYSENARPVVNNDFSHELYESKIINCTAVDNNGDITNNNNTKQRLGALGDHLECTKVKLFGDQPFENPLFEEDIIAQPNGSFVLNKANADAERIESISSVYDDVMDNIKFNENQRIFSDFGINNSDNLAIGTIKLHDDAKSESASSANGKPRQKIKRRKTSTTTTTTTESYDTDDVTQNLFESADDVNPFQDPAQVAILDISKFIPTAKNPHFSYQLDTDFQPIISPYTKHNNYRRTTTPAIIKYETTTSRPSAPYGQPQPNHIAYQYSASNIVNTAQRPNFYVVANKNIAHPNFKAPVNNLLLLKHRRPIQLVRVHKPSV